MPREIQIISETDLKDALRLTAAQFGDRLWRNNSGVAFSPGGVPVRYGLANDSKKANAVCKSSDLIGITPTICPCGRRYGVFTAYEIKRPGWKYTATPEEIAQANFHDIVNKLGGIGKFISDLKDYTGVYGL